MNQVTPQMTADSLEPVAWLHIATDADGERRKLLCWRKHTAEALFDKLDSQPLYSAAQIAALRAENERLKGELSRYKDALTPSNATKAAYIGEIQDERRTVSWTAMKEFMRLIISRATNETQPKGDM